MTGEETVLVQENLAWLPPGSVARLVVSRELPPVDLITTAFALAFDGDALLMAEVRGQERGWNPPGGHIDPGETPASAAEREAREETGAVLSTLVPFGFQHLHVVGVDLPPSPYPRPDSYQVFFLARVERLEAFDPTAEVLSRALMRPPEARATRWVRDHGPFYEAALRLARRS